MLKKVYTSDPVYYRTEAQRRGGMYGAGIPAPYVERLGGLQGLYLRADRRASKGYAVRLPCVFDAKYWPSWAIVLQSFDANTGKFLGCDFDTGWTGFPNYVSSGGDLGGRLFYADHWSQVREASETMEYGAFPDASATITAGALLSAIGDAWIGQPFFVDSVRKLLVHRPGDVRQIQVVDYSAGRTVLHTFDFQGSIVDVFPEDGHRAFAVTDSGLFWLFDYLTGAWLSVFASDLGTSYHIGTQDRKFAWDPIYKRIFTVRQVPDNPDGTSATVIEAYLPLPAAARITPPIPLQTPRKGRTVSVYVRAYDEAGVGMAGQEILLTNETPGQPGTVLVGSGAADWTGVVRFPYRCEEPGEETLTAAAEVP